MNGRLAQYGHVLVYGFAKKSQSERQSEMKKSRAKYSALLSWLLHKSLVCTALFI
jgi:hypothetical protein